MNPVHDDDIFGRPLKPTLKGELAKRFGHPPFSVLNAREGLWQTRKRAWKSLGIQSELGRGANVLGHSVQSGNVDFYSLKRALEHELGRALSTPEAQRILTERGTIGTLDDAPPDGGLESGAGRGGNLLGLSASAEAYRQGKGEYARRADKAATPGGGGGPNSAWLKSAGKKADGRAFNIGMNGSAENDWDTEDAHGSGTSIFDPVLCELLYEWFSPVGGQVIDPFAGGSVRGVVAGCLGRHYWGCDLSAAQVEANRTQVGIVPAGAPVPVWHVGDAQELVPTAPDADFIIACPPYFDLEVYSDDQRDLSRMTWDEFRTGYNRIIRDAAEALRPDRFAAFVVGDVRDDNGCWRGLPEFTTDCFRRAGLALYNSMILVTMVGSLPVRTTTQFTMTRKTGNTHQVILVYVKGDPERATDAVTGQTAAERREQLRRERAVRKGAVAPPKDD